MSLRNWIIFGIIFGIFQIPMLRNWAVLQVAFPFQYVGLILLLPENTARNWTMIGGFFLGLIIDIFSNTPGMHAGTTVLLAYGRISWLRFITDFSDDEKSLNLENLNLLRFTLYCFPLIFAHHFILFVLEKEGFSDFFWTLAKTLSSSLLSFSIVLLTAMSLIRKAPR